MSTPPENKTWVWQATADTRLLITLTAAKRLKAAGEAVWPASADEVTALTEPQDPASDEG